MKIAVIGAGVAGLGTLWHLLQNPKVTATLFDPRGKGGGASGVSTGLLHPFPGKQALRSWQSDEGMKATLQLIQASEKALGNPVSEQSGILRIALSDQQKRDFQKLAEKDPETIWKNHANEILEGAPRVPALWIPQGTTVYSRLYLNGLWKACEKLGAKLELQAVRSLKELESFDAIVITAGFESIQFEECRHLPLKCTKGQTLICRWPNRLPFSLLSQGHITPTSDPSLCQVGSTYEREYSSQEPEPEKAMELFKKTALFYPPAKDFEVLEIRAGVRITRKEGYRPIAAKIAPKAWIFTGLGSRGLLYHAYIGKALAEAILSNRDQLEPNDLYKSLNI